MEHAIALDMGTTSIKCAVLISDGSLNQIEGLSAPSLQNNNDLIFESDPDLYLERVNHLLERKKSLQILNLGICTQRTTFLIWNRKNGKPVTPLISWQDRRAHDWCQNHSHLKNEITKRTGLVLSPHYIGPKLATLLKNDPALRNGLTDGSLLVGSLDSYLIYHWTQNKWHITDSSMAARSLLFEPGEQDWSIPLLKLFSIPRQCLPKIIPSHGLHITLNNGYTLNACIADQSASILSQISMDQSSLLINMGTGIFILKPSNNIRKKNYLTSLIINNPEPLFAIEGTINGTGKLTHNATIIDWNTKDPLAHAYCLPDTSGLGAPHWRSDKEFKIIPSTLYSKDKTRIIFEAIIFRMSEILEDLGIDEKIFISGGASQNHSLLQGLANLLQHDLEILDEPQSSLLGTARLALGLKPYTDSTSTTISYSRKEQYLPDKFIQWKQWIKNQLSFES